MEYQPLIPLPSAIRPTDPSRRQGLLGSLLASNRVVLGVALFLVALLVPLAYADPAPQGQWPVSYAHGVGVTVVALAIAVIAGHLSLQRMGLLPLVSARGLILPSFLSTFGATLVTLCASQAQVVGSLIVAGFVVALLWYYTVSILRGRLLRPVIGLLGITLDARLNLPGNIRWRVIAYDFPNERLAAVVVDPHAELDVAHAQLISQLVLKGIPVYHRAHFEEGLTGRVRFRSHADNNFGALLPSLAYLRVKRAFDLAFTMLVLPVCAVILAVAALCVRLDSPGPVIFRQTRIGFRGRPFTCFKLRTMRTDGEGPAFTLQADPRVTRIGRFLRKWRIDELPQIFNILRGEMSWIGPRPEAIELACDYARHVPFYDYRHAVRPGISGWAAVHQGNVAEVNAARVKLEYDFFYIKYFSIWLDVLIALKTIQTVWSGFGSR